MLFIFVVVQTPRLPISCAAHLPWVLSWSYSFYFYSQTPLYVSFLCGLAKKDTFNFNYLGKLSKVGSVYLQRNIIKTSGSKAGYVGFSLPHLTSQRVKWYELLSFSNKKTF